MKLSEYWVLPLDHVNAGICCDHPFLDSIHVREVSPELDAAYAECEKALYIELDCGNNSCRFAIKRGGMRTNGRCRCVINEAHKIAQILLKQREALAAIKKAKGE